MGSRQIGVNPVDVLERHFGFLFQRHGIQARNGFVAMTDLTQMPHMLVLTVQRGIPLPLLKEHVAVQLGLVLLGHAAASEALGKMSRREVRELRQAERWAAELLIPDAVLEEAQRCEWDDRRLADECEVTLNMARVRMRTWLVQVVKQDGASRFF